MNDIVRDTTIELRPNPYSKGYEVGAPIWRDNSPYYQDWDRAAWNSNLHTYFRTKYVSYNIWVYISEDSFEVVLFELIELITTTQLFEDYNDPCLNKEPFGHNIFSENWACVFDSSGTVIYKIIDLMGTTREDKFIYTDANGKKFLVPTTPTAFRLIYHIKTGIWYVLWSSDYWWYDEGKSFNQFIGSFEVIKTK